MQERIAAVLDSGVFILGPNVKAFEAEAAEQLGVPHTVGVANGTDALVLALDAMEIGPGDEVICLSVPFYATAEPLAGLAGLEIPIVEDAAQAYGAQGVAQVGALSTFSFFPTKNLFALGDGGLIAANDEELADRITLLRFHGSKDKKDFEAVGYNSRLDELQAAGLRLFLGEIDGWNAARRDAAARYEELGLAELCELPADEPGHVYHMYVVRSPDRDRFREALAAAGIGNASYYVMPLHLQPALRYLGWQAGSLPETEKASAENLALPMWAGIPATIQERVVSV